VRVLAVAVSAWLAGCASEGRPLPAWTLEVDGGAHQVELPGALRDLLPSHTSVFALRGEIALDPSERGRPLTFVVPCFHGPLQLSASGEPIAEIDAGVGEHRFVIPAALTAGPTLALELRAEHDNATLQGFGLAPVLVAGVHPEPSGVALFNRYLAISAFALIGVFATLYAVLYALDRRREDGAFVVMAIGCVFAPLWSLGLLERYIGDRAILVHSLLSAVALIALLYTTHYTFGIERARRPWVIAFVLCALGSIGTQFSLRVQPVMLPIGYIVTTALFVNLVIALVPLARAGARRMDARLTIGGIAIATVVAITEGVAKGGHRLGGLHVGPTTIVLYGLVQAIVLARGHVARARAIERANVELQRQVAERSKELADALARLSQQPRAELEAGGTIDGRYRVVRELGAGGMGSVHEVERIADGERFALKRVRGHADSSALARFAREAQIAAELRHPNLVPVIDVGISDGELFLVMPVIAGGALATARDRFGDAAWARPLLAQIAAGLAALHARGIVHRDLKPANILIDRGVARIADFGLAALHAGAAPIAAEGTRSLSDVALAATASPEDPMTRTGDVFGTPAYLAPELAAGVRHARPSSDVFAFGVLAYEMLAGTPPFATAPVLDRLAGRAIAAPPPLPEPLIMPCLALEPDARPTADELAAGLAIS